MGDAIGVLKKHIAPISGGSCAKSFLCLKHCSIDFASRGFGCACSGALEFFDVGFCLDQDRPVLGSA